MNHTSVYKKTIEHQFDCFCKTVLRNQARNIYSKNKRELEKFISLEALTQAELNELSILDVYESNYISFTALEYNVSVEDVLVAQANASLSKKKQDIILLSFFLEMKDIDIASLMNLANSTVHYHKENALKELRKFMEEHTNEK